MRLGIGDHFGAAGKFFAEARIPPRGDNLDFWSESRSCEFEANLIVTLARGPVGYSRCPLGAGDLDHALRDERARNACAEKILSLINRPGLQHRKNKITGELLLQVIHIAFRSPCFESLFLESIEFLGLSHVRAEGDDFGSVGIFEPVQNDRGVQTSRVSDDDFFHTGAESARKNKLSQSQRTGIFT